MDKVKFLKQMIILSSWVLLSWQTLSQIDETKKETEDIVDFDKLNIYEKSFLLAWEREIETFKNFFWVSDNHDDFVKKVREIQWWWDWILWPKTLRKLYFEYYSKKIDKMDFETKKRWKIYNEMLWYEKISWALYSFLDVFHVNDYYWKYLWINKDGTFINENLFWKIPNEIKTKTPKIIISKLWKKRYLAFYINWRLFLATYVSPWFEMNKTNKVIKHWDRYPDKYHISSLYPTLEESKNWKVWWFVMPYAVHVDGAIWIHGSDSRIDWNLQSHGCIRTPLLYMKEIFEKVKELWVENVVIDTTGIY